jgi:WD40 repeat protein
MPMVRGLTSRARCLLVAALLLFGWVAVVLPADRAAASPSQVADVTAGVNGIVYDTVYIGGRTFLAGLFTWAGPRTGSGVPVDPMTGARTSVPRVNGPVHAAAADAAGGWYVGGQFVFAGGKTRNNAARVTSSGGVAAWDPSVNGPVTAVAVRGTVVYLGGNFSSVGGQARSNLAAVSSDTGAVLAWNPGSSSAVDALAVSPDGATVYAGGSSGAKAISAATGNDLSWGSALSGAVSALAAVDDTVYVGGAAAATAVDAATGSVTAWTAPTDAAVRALAVSGGVTYLGGAFTTVAGVARGRLAALASGAVTPWNPGADGTVNSVQLSSDGATLYTGGDFTTLGGQSRNRSGAVGTADGVLTGWHPSADASVTTVVQSGSRILVGGLFDQLNGLPRRNAAALTADGEVDAAWNPNPDDVVYAIDTSADGAIVFLGGRFLNLGTAARSKLAAVNATTGAVLSRASWPTGLNGNVRAMEVSGTRLYVGGAFTRAAGLDTGRLVALNAANGAVDTAFAPRPSGTVRALLVSPDGTKVYAGGEYTTIGGASRPGAAELLATPGAATSFAPASGGVVIAAALTPDGSRVYFCTTSNRTYAYDPAVGNSLVYTVRTGGDVQGIAASATEVYIGGHFTTLPEAKLNRVHAASFLVSTGAPTAWNPAPDGIYGVWSIEVTPTALHVGGDFAKVGGKAQPGFARFSGTP